MLILLCIGHFLVGVGLGTTVGMRRQWPAAVIGAFTVFVAQVNFADETLIIRLAGPTVLLGTLLGLIVPRVRRRLPGVAPTRLVTPTPERLPQPPPLKLPTPRQPTPQPINVNVPNFRGLFAQLFATPASPPAIGGSAHPPGEGPPCWVCGRAKSEGTHAACGGVS